MGEGAGKAHLYMGEYVLSNTGDFGGAIMHLQQAVELYTKIGDGKTGNWGLGTLARVFLSLGDLQKAETCTNQSLEITESLEKFSDAHIISLCQGRVDKAARMLQKATGSYRNNAQKSSERAFRLGRAYLAQEKRKEALDLFEEAMGLEPTDFSTFVDTTFVDTLSSLEETHNNPEAFRSFCQGFREDHPESVESALLQWYLEPSEPRDFRQNRLSGAFAHSLSSDWTWHDPFEDCREFFNRTYDGLASELPYKDDPTYLATDALGSWIVWNLFDHAPESTQERQLVRVLGGLVIHSFFRWWSPS